MDWLAQRIGFSSCSASKWREFVEDGANCFVIGNLASRYAYKTAVIFRSLGHVFGLSVDDLALYARTRILLGIPEWDPQRRTGKQASLRTWIINGARLGIFEAKQGLSVICAPSKRVSEILTRVERSLPGKAERRESPDEVIEAELLRLTRLEERAREARVRVAVHFSELELQGDTNRTLDDILHSLGVCEKPCSIASKRAEQEATARERSYADEAASIIQIVLSTVVKHRDCIPGLTMLQKRQILLRYLCLGEAGPQLAKEYGSNKQSVSNLVYESLKDATAVLYPDRTPETKIAADGKTPIVSPWMKRARHVLQEIWRTLSEKTQKALFRRLALDWKAYQRRSAA